MYAFRAREKGRQINRPVGEAGADPSGILPQSVKLAEKKLLYTELHFAYSPNKYFAHLR